MYCFISKTYLRVLVRSSNHYQRGKMMQYKYESTCTVLVLVFVAATAAVPFHEHDAPNEGILKCFSYFMLHSN